MFYPKLQANGYYSICKFTKVSKAYNSERHLYFTMKQLVEGGYFFSNGVFIFSIYRPSHWNLIVRVILKQHLQINCYLAKF